MPILGPEVPVSAPVSAPTDRAMGTVASVAAAFRNSNYDNNLGPLVTYLIPPGQPAVKITLSGEYGKLTHLAVTASGFAAVWLDGLYQREELHAARFSAWGAIEQKISVG